MTNRFYIFLVVLSMPLAAGAQSLSLGADFMSRYVWRGLDFGDSFSIQPGLTFGHGSFEVGAWASYSVSADGADANESDLWAGYSFATESAGTFGVGITDYYFPNSDASSFTNFDGEGAGAHYLEPYVSYEAPGATPISLYAAMIAYNDTQHSVYVEAGLPLDVGGTELGIALGLVAGASDFYGVESASVINISFSASQDLKITDTFSLPLSAAYIVNPTHEVSYLVFGFSLSP